MNATVTRDTLESPEVVLVHSLLDYLRSSDGTWAGPAEHALWLLLEAIGDEDLDDEERAGIHATLTDYVEKWAHWADV